RGGQGIVFRASNARLHDRLLAYKQYHEDVVDEIDFDVIRRLITVLLAQSSSVAELLLHRTAWPVALVRRGARFTGVLMPMASKPFFGNAGSPPRTVLSRMEYLLNSSDMHAYRSLALGPKRRLTLLLHFAQPMT